MGRGFVYGTFCLIAHIEKIIQVISADGGHGKYLAGLNVHRDSTRPVLDIVILHCLIERFFDIMLYRKINCRHKVVAVFRARIALELIKKQVGTVSVCKTHILTRRSAQRGIILCLDSVESVVIGADKAYNMAGKRRVRIISLCVAFKAHALELIFVFKFAYLVGGLFFDLACNGDIPRAVILGFFEYVLTIKPQYL